MTLKRIRRNIDLLDAKQLEDVFVDGPESPDIGIDVPGDQGHRTRIDQGGSV